MGKNLKQEDLCLLLDLARQAALSAGKIILKGFGAHGELHHKDSPGGSLASQVVTQVDLESQKAIFQVLGPTLARFDLAWLGEESPDSLDRLSKDYFWSVDPLDGTLSFVEGKSGFSVSIALVAKDGIPWIGVVFDPTEQVLYHAIRGLGAYRNGVLWKPKPLSRHLTLAFDRSFLESDLLAPTLAYWRGVALNFGLEGVVLLESGGAVCIACQVLEHAPALYYKLPREVDRGGSVWDYAATACLYGEVGGVATDFCGGPMELNRPSSTYMNHKGILFASDAFWATQVRQFQLDFASSKKSSKDSNA